MMKDICNDISEHVSDVLAEWEELVRDEPWISLPPQHRIDSLPDVIIGIVQCALCDPDDQELHRKAISHALEHGKHRRDQKISDQTMLAEYHALRQALWSYISKRFGHSEQSSRAIIRIDTGISVATKGSLWGYHNVELAAAGKWEDAVERILKTSPLTRLSGS
jgi:hypothetical protein